MAEMIGSRPPPSRFAQIDHAGTGEQPQGRPAQPADQGALAGGTEGRTDSRAGARARSSGVVPQLVSNNAAARMAPALAGL